MSQAYGLSGQSSVPSHPVPCVCWALQGQITPVTVTLMALVMLNLAPAKSAYRAVVAASIPAQVQAVLDYQLRFNS